MRPEEIRQPLPLIRFVTLSTKIWGAETTLLTLVAELSKLNVATFQLVAPSGPLTEEWTKRGIGSLIFLPDSYANIQRRADLLTSQPRLAKLLRRLPPARIVHSHHQWTHIPVALSSIGSSVLDLHDFVPTGLGRALQSVAVLMASRSLVASQTVRRQLPKILWRKTTVLNRPVDLPAIPVSRAARSANRRTLRFIIVCRPDPNKRFVEAVQPLLAAMDPDDELAVVGGSPHEFDPKAALSSDPRVVFRGRLQGSDLEQAWRRADIHVLTSPFEPFGRVVVEAAMRGLPSILHESAGAARVVASTHSGILVEDWSTVGKHLSELRLQNSLLRFAPGLKLMVELHSPGSVAEEYRQQITQLLVTTDAPGALKRRTD